MYLFIILILFNDALNSSDIGHVAWNYTVCGNNESVIFWKEVIKNQFKLLYWKLLGGTEERQRIYSQESRTFQNTKQEYHSIDHDV
jgi:hypothetical protein